MEAAEPSEAAAALEQLIQGLLPRTGDGPRLDALWEAFKRLIHRRGYFTASAAEVAASLDEIAAVGDGFDLYDLARGLARYDALRTECARKGSRRGIPELKRFSPSCACGKHRKEK